MNTFVRYPLRSLFVGASLAMLLSAEPAQADIFIYDPSNSVALPLFMDTRGNPSSLPGNGWYTMAVIQNTSASIANVRVTAKPKQGGAGTSITTTFTIGPRSSMVVRPDNPVGIAGTIGIPGLSPAGNFEGSLLIESDQPLVVVGELANIPLGSMGVAGGTAKGFYNGIRVNESSGTLAFPMMKSGINGKSTVVYVKNTSTTPATLADNVTLKVKTNDGLTYTAPVVLAAGESKAFKGTDFQNGNDFWTTACTGGANAGQPGAACFGAAKLESTNSSLTFVAVAVQRAVAETSPSPSVHVATFERGDATGPVSCSVFRNAYQTTARSDVSLMNTGTSNVDITLKLIADKSYTQYTQTFAGVLPGRSVMASGWAANLGGFPDGAIGSATISSSLAGSSTPDNHIVAAVSESGVGTNESSYQCSRRSGPLFAPFVKFAYFDANHPVPATSEVHIQNVGTGPKTLTITYTCTNLGGKGTYTVQKTVSEGSSVEINSASFGTRGGIPTGSICYAVVTGSVFIVGTVTERNSSPSLADDATYEFHELRPDVDSSGNQLNPCPSSLCSSGVCCSGP